MIIRAYLLLFVDRNSSWTNVDEQQETTDNGYSLVDVRSQTDDEALTKSLEAAMEVSEGHASRKS